MSNQNDNIQLDEELWQQTPPKPDPLEEEYAEKEKNYRFNLEREAKILTSKAGLNQVSRGYYIQLKKILEDLLMLELAQQAAEAQVKFDTYQGLIEITDSGLTSFREELEKIKKLKLVNSLLSLTSLADNQNIVIHELIHDLYGKEGSLVPHKETQSDYVTLSQLHKLLLEYADRINNNIKRKEKG